ncbi:MAG TPA: hypothetical protein VGM03_18230 [Phycisphaerae bacterium]|jgi:hypothetical protein
MRHRHLNTTDWTLDAIDSVLERGDLPDWRELFAAVRSDRRIAEKVLHVASQHDLGGASRLARELTCHCWPDLRA